jgi:hypothetical protein
MFSICLRTIMYVGGFLPFLEKKNGEGVFSLLHLYKKGGERQSIKPLLFSEGPSSLCMQRDESEGPWKSFKRSRVGTSLF